MATPFKDAEQVDGVEVWRIESLKPVKQSKEEIGEFCSGDSYIVLATEKEEDSLKHHIHFWLGSDTSQEESGGAAILVTELNKHLGGKVKQTRELQNEESAEFKKLFGEKLKYKKGGGHQGFAHVPKKIDQNVEDNTEESTQSAELSLYKVEQAKRGGAISLKTIQTSKLSRQQLNSNDIFVIQSGMEVFSWQGKNTGKQRKTGKQLTDPVSKQLKLPSDTNIQDVKEGSEPASFENLFSSDEQLSKSDETSKTHLASPDKIKQESKDEKSSNSGKQSTESGKQLNPALSKTNQDGNKGKKLENPSEAGVSIQNQSLNESSQSAKKQDSKTNSQPHRSELESNGLANGGQTGQNGAERISSLSQIEKRESSSNSERENEQKLPSENKQGANLQFSNGQNGDDAQSRPGSAKSRPSSAQLNDSELTLKRKSSREELKEGTRELDYRGHIKPSESAKYFQGSTFIPSPQTPEPEAPARSTEDVKLVPGQDSIPYSQLKGMRADDGIDMTQKENYLSADEFEKVFGKSKEEFKTMQKWRQLQAKKTAGLF